MWCSRYVSSMYMKTWPGGGLGGTRPSLIKSMACNAAGTAGREAIVVHSILLLLNFSCSANLPTTKQVLSLVQQKRFARVTWCGGSYIGARQRKLANRKKLGGACPVCMCLYPGGRQHAAIIF